MASSVPIVLGSNVSPFLRPPADSPFVLASTRLSPITLLEQSSRTGATIIASFGAASAGSGMALLIYMLIAWRRLARQTKRGHPITAEELFLRTRIGLYVISLIISGIVGGVGAFLSVEWATRGLIITGMSCTAQGAILQIAGVAMAVFHILIAIHIFGVIVLKKMFSTALVIASIAATWIIASVIAFIGPIMNQSMYQSVGLWCWITNTLPFSQFFMYYLPTFVAAGLIFILYMVVFLSLRRNGSFLNSPTAAHRILPQNLSRDDYRNYLRLIMKKLIWYPVLYVLLVLPLSVCRMLAMAGVVAPDIIWIFSASALAFVGLANVAIFLLIRRTKMLTPNQPGARSIRRRDEKTRSIESFIGNEKAPYLDATLTRPASKAWMPTFPPPPPRPLVPTHRRTSSGGSSSTSDEISVYSQDTTMPAKRKAPSFAPVYPPRSNQQRKDQVRDGLQVSSDLPYAQRQPPTILPSTLRSLARPESDWKGFTTNREQANGTMLAVDFLAKSPKLKTTFAEAGRYPATTGSKEREIPMALRPAPSKSGRSPKSSPSSSEQTSSSPEPATYPNKPPRSEAGMSSLISLYRSPSSVPQMPTTSFRPSPAIPDSATPSGDSLSPSPVRTTTGWRSAYQATRPTDSTPGLVVGPNRDPKVIMANNPNYIPPAYELAGPYSIARSPSGRQLAPPRRSPSAGPSRYAGPSQDLGPPVGYANGTPKIWNAGGKMAF